MTAHNKNKSIGKKPPLQWDQVQAIKTALVKLGTARDRALFALAIDSSLRGHDYCSFAGAMYAALKAYWSRSGKTIQNQRQHRKGRYIRTPALHPPNAARNDRAGRYPLGRVFVRKDHEKVQVPCPAFRTSLPKSCEEVGRIYWLKWRAIRHPLPTPHTTSTYLQEHWQLTRLPDYSGAYEYYEYTGVFGD